MDEIGDMSLSAQAKVLRALQESKISRVGSDKDVVVDVRVVAATNKDIKAEIAKGNFREDLYHRLSVIVIKVPPLRDRAGDIAELVHYFIEKIAAEHNIPPKPVDIEAMAALKAMLGIYAKVRLVAPKSIARSEGKAVRIIDKRKI